MFFLKIFYWNIVDLQCCVSVQHSDSVFLQTDIEIEYSKFCLHFVCVWGQGICLYFVASVELQNVVPCNA